MSLLAAELRKVWGNRVFPLLLAVLAAANLLLLWMGRARHRQPAPPPRPTALRGRIWLPSAPIWRPRGSFSARQTRRDRGPAAARQLLPRPRLR